MNIVLYDKRSLSFFQYDLATGDKVDPVINIHNIEPINLMIADLEVINYSDLIIFYHNKQVKILKDRIYGNHNEVWTARVFFDYYDINKMIQIIRLFDNEGKMVKMGD